MLETAERAGVRTNAVQEQVNYAKSRQAESRTASFQQKPQAEEGSKKSQTQWKTWLLIGLAIYFLPQLKQRLTDYQDKAKKPKPAPRSSQPEEQNKLTPSKPTSRSQAGNPLVRGLASLTEDMGEMKRPGEVTQRLSDVKGIDEITGEIKDVIDMLKNREEYRKKGATLPKGILLYGKPGTGKTLIARAMAGEAGVTFFHYTGSQFDELFVGVGAKRVRAMFERAKKNRPCILFIDEIDTLLA